MSADFSVEVIRSAVILTLMDAGPLLITSLLIGVLVSLIQAITQIQEQTLTFIPKIVGLAIVLLITLPWILSQLVGYLVNALTTLRTVG